MDFGLSEAEESLRQEVREFLIKELPPGWGKHFFLPDDEFPLSDELWALHRQLAPKLHEKGWQPMTWPKEYWGYGASQTMDLIFQEELYYQGAPGRDMFGISLVGPMLLRFGTEEQKLRHLKPIAEGKIFWCEGFSEPEAGSDLGSARTKAVEDSDGFIINGQKLWTSAAHRAYWIFLLARTDPDVPKHKGLSLFLVDLKTPGITIRPVMDIAGGRHFNEVNFEDVRVPRESLVGEKNQGWPMAMAILNRERSTVEPLGTTRRLVEEVVEYLKGTEGDVTRNPLTSQRLAEISLQIEVARLLHYRVAWMQDKGLDARYQINRARLITAYLKYNAINTVIHLLGPYSQLKEGSPWAPLWGRVPIFYLYSYSRIIGGGTVDIQRNQIARGLGLPRSY